jgi:hypothetical protein
LRNAGEAGHESVGKPGTPAGGMVEDFVNPFTSSEKSAIYLREQGV